MRAFVLWQARGGGSWFGVAVQEHRWMGWSLEFVFLMPLGGDLRNVPLQGMLVCAMWQAQNSSNRKKAAF
eukprot:7644622-Lingulodinium_polyedra.AAC.1